MTVTEQKKQDSTIVSQSYSKNNAVIVVDVDNMKYMDFEKHQPALQKESSSDTSFLLLLLYTVIISILFVYREKQNKIKLIYQEKIGDAIKIKLAEEEQRPKTLELLKNDLKKHKEIMAPELKLEKIEQDLTEDPTYIIIKARVVLEKTILKLYKFYFQEESTLNEMLYALNKKRILSPALNNYAHTIKAFGNKALHPSLDVNDNYKPKDALLVLNTLLQYLEDLKSVNLPEK